MPHFGNVSGDWILDGGNFERAGHWKNFALLDPDSNEVEDSDDIDKIILEVDLCAGRRFREDLGPNLAGTKSLKFTLDTGSTVTIFRGAQAEILLRIAKGSGALVGSGAISGGYGEGMMNVPIVCVSFKFGRFWEEVPAYFVTPDVLEENKRDRNLYPSKTTHLLGMSHLLRKYVIAVSSECVELFRRSEKGHHGQPKRRR